MGTRGIQGHTTLGWIDATDESRWTATLYREAAGRGAPAFRRWALDHLARAVPFTAAAWCTRRLGDERLTAVTVRGLTASALEPLLTLGNNLWVPPALLQGSGRSVLVRHDLAQLAAANVQAAALRRQRFADALVCLCAHADSLFFSIVCVLHESGFSADAAATLQARLPHLAQAESLALESRLQLDRRLAASGRRNRGLSCLADSQGYIRAAAPGFGDLIRRHVRDWEGLRLPFDMRNRKTMQREAMQQGLHVRVVETRHSWLQVHVREAHPFDTLTDREHDIVKAMVDGESYKAVARRLGVSASTVANHASNIYRKLGAYNRDEVVTLAASFTVARDSVSEADAD